MKLGKKLEVTDKKERMKLLIDGEVFLIDTNTELFFSEDSDWACNPFRIGCDIESNAINKSWYMDWYYPAKTYIINGVELEDNRLSYDKAVSPQGFYLSPRIPSEEACFSHNNPFVSKERLKLLCDHSLVHSTAEAAMAHTKAMLRVEK